MQSLYCIFDRYTHTHTHQRKCNRINVDLKRFHAILFVCIFRRENAVQTVFNDKSSQIFRHHFLLQFHLPHAIANICIEYFISPIYFVLFLSNCLILLFFSYYFVGVCVCVCHFEHRVECFECWNTTFSLIQRREKNRFQRMHRIGCTHFLFHKTSIRFGLEYSVHSMNIVWFNLSQTANDKRRSRIKHHRHEKIARATQKQSISNRMELRKVHRKLKFIRKTQKHSQFLHTNHCEGIYKDVKVT